MKRMKKMSISVVTTWLISYVVILLFPFFISLILYFFSFGIIEEQCVDSSRLISTNMAFKIDQLFLDNKETKEKLNGQPSVLRLAEADQGMLYNVNPAIQAELNDVRQRMKMQNKDATVALLLNRTGMVVMQDDIVTLSNFIATLGVPEESNMIAQIRYSQSGQYFVMGSGEGEQILFYCAPVVSSSIFDDARVLVWCKIPSLIEEIDQLRGRVLLEYVITDQIGNYVVTSKKFTNDNIAKANVEYYRRGALKLDGDKYYLEAIESETLDFHYLFAISYIDLFGKLRTYKILMVLSAFICIGLGVVMIYLFIRNNYKSVDSILSKIKHISGINPGKEKNEYVAIRQALDTLEQKNTVTLSRLDESTNRLTNEIISKMLMGIYISRREYEEIVKSLPFRYHGKYYLVLAMEIWDDSAFYQEEDITEEEKKKTDFFILENVFSELLEPYQCYFIELNGQLTTILNADSVDGKLNEIIEHGRQFITQNFGLKFSVALSDEQEELYGIGRKYRQCLALLETGRTFEKNAVLTTELMPPTTDFYSYSSDKEEKLLNHLKNQNYEACMKLLDSIFEDSFTSSLAIMRENNYMLYSIMGTVIRYISSLSLEETDNEIILNMVLDVFDANVAGTARDALSELIAYLCNMDMNANSKDSDFLTRKSLDIVEREFGNPSLSVTYIADQLGFHPVYVSSRFKGKSGEGLLEYISKYRIIKAKEIMTEHEEVTVEDVSVMVGYTNVKTFSRVFRKLEGITPAKWRNSIRPEEPEDE